MKKRLILLLAIGSAPLLALGQSIVFNDSWADGGLTDGPDATDAAWYTSTTSSAIEVGTGFMGVVSGSSGRGIHGLYTPTSLNVGDSLTLTFTFTTPATVGTGRTDALRVGLMNSLGRPALAGNQSLSTSSPNPLFDALPGYMATFDVNTGAENVQLMRHDEAAVLGRFMSTTAEWLALDTGGSTYSILAGTEYVGVLAITRSGADELTVGSTLWQGGSALTSHTAISTGAVPTSFDMLGFQVNSATFGSSNVVGTPDNGIDFSNITLEYSVVPEPSTYAFILGALVLGLGFLRRRK